MKTVIPWALRATEILADGEWHDGLTIMREMSKLIPPGIAVRRAERNREYLSARRHDGPEERIVQRSQSELIRFGKRSIVTSYIVERRRFGSWEIDPWPIPKDGYRVGNWKVRDVTAGRVALSVICTRLGVTTPVARRLLAIDPPIEAESIGRCTYIRDVEAFEARVTAHKSPDPERVGDPATMLSLSQLSKRGHIGPQTCRDLQLAHPELPWHYRGRGTYLPPANLAEWDVIVAAHKAEHAPRGRALPPFFKDPQLDDTFRRYFGGDQSARDEMIAHMQRVFHTADHEAGDASPPDPKECP